MQVWVYLLSCSLTMVSLKLSNMAYLSKRVKADMIGCEGTGQDQTGTYNAAD